MTVTLSYDLCVNLSDLCVEYIFNAETAEEDAKIAERRKIIMELTELQTKHEAIKEKVTQLGRFL